MKPYNIHNVVARYNHYRPHGYWPRPPLSTVMRTKSALAFRKATVERTHMVQVVRDDQAVVSPLYCHAEVTALVAHRVILDTLVGTADRRLAQSAAHA